MDDGAWDSEGRFWPAGSEYLSLQEVLELIERGDVPVGVQGGFRRTAAFFEPPDGQRVWAEKIRHHFAPDGDLGAGGWPEHVAYVAELRQRPDGSRLLWFDGQC